MKNCKKQGVCIHWFRWILSLLLLVFPFFVFAQLENKSAEDSLIYYSVQEIDLAFETAKRERKSLIIDFTADWCLPCRQMEKTTLKDPTLIQCFNKKYVWLKVDVSSLDGMALSHEYKVTRYPTYIQLKGRKMRTSKRLAGFQSVPNMKKAFCSCKRLH